MKIAFFSALSALLTGCATVAPYEREEMSRTAMDSTYDSAAIAFRAHVHESREGAAGGYGSAGGGCGCN